MAEAKLERMNQYVRELSEDLDRPRIKTSEAAKAYGVRSSLRPTHVAHVLRLAHLTSGALRVGGRHTGPRGQVHGLLRTNT